MNVDIARHALDRVPLSLIIDDSTVLLNLNYFFLRQCEEFLGRKQRWQDIPVVHPESFTREFFEWCHEHGVKGKFSVVPCPAGIGRIDRSLPLISRRQQEQWLEMARGLIMPAFDITPEMITHTYVVDTESMTPPDPSIWEQWGWDRLPDDEARVTRYIETACRILDNVGLTPTGVTSPGGFGNPIERYARCAATACRSVTGRRVPFFFKRVSQNRIESPVWFPDRETATAMGEVIACTGDWTGSWTGYGDADADRYIGPDLDTGRLPEVIRAGDPAIMISHWQGFYGLHDDDRRGFRVLKTVVERLHRRDPLGETTRWSTCSDIATYACARQMARIEVRGSTIDLDLPIQPPDLTVRVTGIDAAHVTVNGNPLKRVQRRRDFRAGTFLAQVQATLIAFTPAGRSVQIRIA